jgi:hypothetical protein
MVQFITRHRTPAAEHMQKWRDIGKASFVFSCVGIVGMVIPECATQAPLPRTVAWDTAPNTLPLVSCVSSAQRFAAVQYVRRLVRKTNSAPVPHCRRYTSLWGRMRMRSCRPSTASSTAALRPTRGAAAISLAARPSMRITATSNPENKPA